MKNLAYTLVVALLIAAAPVAAQTHAQAQASAGVTPDSPLYGLEIALENVRNALTFNSAAKARISLEQADERIAEMQAMIDANNTQAAARAASNYQARVNAAANAAERISNDGSEERARRGLEQSTQARAQLQANMARVAQVHAEILTRQEGRMSGEQIAHLEAVFANVTQAGVSADAQIESKREQSKQRYQAIANVDAQQAAAVAQNISAQQGLQASLDAHKNALGGLSIALEADSNRSEQATMVLTDLIERFNASARTEMRGGAGAGADIGAGAQANTQAGIAANTSAGINTQARQESREREEQNGSASAQANASADAQISGSQTRGSAQGGVEIGY